MYEVVKCREDGLQKGQKGGFPLVHHAFEVESGGREYHIDVVSEDAP